VIGLFRQFMSLLSFPFILSVGIALLLAIDWAGWLPFTIGLA